jgi:hypothetical protein
MCYSHVGITFNTSIFHTYATNIDIVYIIWHSRSNAGDVTKRRVSFPNSHFRTMTDHHLLPQCVSAPWVWIQIHSRCNSTCHHLSKQKGLGHCLQLLTRSLTGTHLHTRTYTHTHLHISFLNLLLMSKSTFSTAFQSVLNLMSAIVMCVDQPRADHNLHMKIMAQAHLLGQMTTNWIAPGVGSVNLDQRRIAVVGQMVDTQGSKVWLWKTDSTFCHVARVRSWVYNCANNVYICCIGIEYWCIKYWYIWSGRFFFGSVYIFRNLIYATKSIYR